MKPSRANRHWRSHQNIGWNATKYFRPVRWKKRCSTKEIRSWIKGTNAKVGNVQDILLHSTSQIEIQDKYGRVSQNTARTDDRKVHCYWDQWVPKIQGGCLITELIRDLRNGGHTEGKNPWWEATDEALGQILTQNPPTHSNGQANNCRGQGMGSQRHGREVRVL